MLRITLDFYGRESHTIDVPAEWGEYLTRMTLAINKDVIVSMPFTMHGEYRLHSVCRLYEVPEPGTRLEIDPNGTVDVVEI